MTWHNEVAWKKLNSNILYGISKLAENQPDLQDGKKDKVKYRIGSVMSVYLIVNLARGNKRDNLSPQGDQDYRIFITCR